VKPANVSQRDLFAGATVQAVAPVADKIPFNRPSCVGEEFTFIREALESGYVAGGGSFTRRVEQALSAAIGGQALLTTSCTHALEMTALLLDLREGDEVIVPSFAFVSCANAYALRGARPVFADVSPGTFNLDPQAVADALTPRTRAVVAIHYGGIACDFDGLRHAIGTRDVALIEDNAHGLYGTFRSKPLGSFGRFSTLSFHETKNFHCGEGGAIVLNDPNDVERAEILREKGTNRALFFRKLVDKYRWVDLGSSYVMSDILAAYLLAQLQRREAVQQKRARIWRRYHDELRDTCERLGWQRPFVPPDCEGASHLYFLVLDSLERRTAFIAYLAEAGVQAVFHYQPLHRSPYAEKAGFGGAHCPVTDVAADRLVRLPFYFDLSDEQQTRVVETIREFAARQ